MQIKVISAIRRIIAKDSDETVARYTQEMMAVMQSDKAAKKEWQETIGKTIKALEAGIKEASAKIKDASTKEKHAIGESIKKNKAKIETLKTEPVNHFMRLPLETKQFAAAVHLLQNLIIKDLVVIEKYADLFTYDEKISAPLTNYEKFRESQIGADILEVSDYVFNRVAELEAKITGASDIMNIIKGDFFKYTGNDFDPNLEQVLEISRAYYNELSEREKQSQNLTERIERSKTGIKPLKEYDNGLIMYEMLPSPRPDGKPGHVSLTFESDEMRHCIGRGGGRGYDEQIGKEGYRYFSLRSLNKEGILEPHCTIEISSNRLAQIKGKSNGNVKFPYIPAVRDFVKSLGYEGDQIPSSELANIGYIDGFDLYNLPPRGATIENLSLYSGDYKYIDLARLNIKDTLIFKDTMTAADLEAFEKIPGGVNYLDINAKNLPIGLLKSISKYIHGVKATGVTQDFFDALPALKHELDINGNGSRKPMELNADKYSVRDFLAKIKGTDWVGRNYSENNGKIIVIGDLRIPNWINTIPVTLKDTFVEGKVEASTARFSLKQMPYSTQGARWFERHIDSIDFKEAFRKIYGDDKTNAWLKFDNDKLIKIIDYTAIQALLDFRWFKIQENGDYKKLPDDVESIMIATIAEKMQTDISAIKDLMALNDKTWALEKIINDASAKLSGMFKKDELTILDAIKIFNDHSNTKSRFWGDNRDILREFVERNTKDNREVLNMLYNGHRWKLESNGDDQFFDLFSIKENGKLELAIRRYDLDAGVLHRTLQHYVNSSNFKLNEIDMAIIELYDTRSYIIMLVDKLIQNKVDAAFIHKLIAMMSMREKPLEAIMTYTDSEGDYEKLKFHIVKTLMDNGDFDLVVQCDIGRYWPDPYKKAFHKMIKQARSKKKANEIKSKFQEGIRKIKTKLQPIARSAGLTIER